jgi:hypothetical protein
MFERLNSKCLSWGWILGGWDIFLWMKIKFFNFFWMKTNFGKLLTLRYVEKI